MTSHRPVLRLSPWPLLYCVMFWVILLLWLTGCAQTPRPVQVVPSVERVLVPVPCVADPKTLPPEPPRVASLLNGQSSHDLLIVAPSALDLRTWGEKLNAALLACSAASPPVPTP